MHACVGVCMYVYVSVHVCICTCVGACVWACACMCIDCMYIHIFCTGGLAFSLHNIGTSLGIVGVMMIPISVVAFAPVSDCVVCTVIDNFH